MYVRHVVIIVSTVKVILVLSESNREIGFGFVSCSCRACERAGEAKLRGRVSGVPPQRWALGLKFVRLRAGTF